MTTRTSMTITAMATQDDAFLEREPYRRQDPIRGKSVFLAVYGMLFTEEEEEELRR